MFCGVYIIPGVKAAGFHPPTWLDKLTTLFTHIFQHIYNTHKGTHNVYLCITLCSQTISVSVYLLGSQHARIAAIRTTSQLHYYSFQITNTLDIFVSDLHFLIVPAIFFLSLRVCNFLRGFALAISITRVTFAVQFSAEKFNNLFGIKFQAALTNSFFRDVLFDSTKSIARFAE